MPTTADRSRGRQAVRSEAQGAVGEHMSKIMMALITALVVVIFALVMTKPGRAVDAATQRFMLYYAGVFALIGLTASVGVGLLATDRIVMTPGHRVMAQAVHQAVSFGAVTGARRLVLFHHDPQHTDDDLDVHQARARELWQGSDAPPELAYEGMELSLQR